MAVSIVQALLLVDSGQHIDHADDELRVALEKAQAAGAVRTTLLEGTTRWSWVLTDVGRRQLGQFKPGSSGDSLTLATMSPLSAPDELAKRMGWRADKP